MDDTYSHYEFHDLPLMQVQAPVVTEAYHTIDELLNTPPQGNYSSIPTNQFQQPEKIRFYKYEYEPLLTSMAFPVVEFSRQGYKIRKVFGKKSTLFK